MLFIRYVFVVFSLFVFSGASIAFARDEHAFKEPAKDISFSVIVTAESGGAQEAMVVAGGDWLTSRKLVQTAVLVRHPKGDFLWDSGIGTQISAQMETFSFVERELFKIENIRPVVQQLKQVNYPASALKAIIPSHMHWDHVSALEDFELTPVWVQQREYDAAMAGKAPSFVKAQFDSPAINWAFIVLENKPYAGFERSLDIYADGSVVLVDLSGHTLGQLGLFLTTPSKGQYFFIGDTTWVLKGVAEAASRPVFVNWLVGVDADVDKNAAVINRIHALSQQNPELVIVPAHDEKVNATLPNFPEFL